MSIFLDFHWFCEFSEPTKPLQMDEFFQEDFNGGKVRNIAKVFSISKYIAI